MIIAITTCRPTNLAIQIEHLPDAGFSRDRDRLLLIETLPAPQLDPLVREIRENRGWTVWRLSITGNVSEARAIGYRLAHRTWIVEISDHDYLLPDSLRYIEEYARQGHDVLYGGHLHTDGERHLPQPYSPGFFRSYGIPSCAPFAFHSDVYHDVGGYRAHEYPSGDVALLCRLELITERICAIPHALARHSDEAGISSELRGESDRVGIRAMIAARDAAFRGQRFFETDELP